MDPERIATLMREYQAGVPLAELEARYGIERTAIDRIRRKLDIPPRRPRRAPYLEPGALDEVRKRLSG